MLFASTRAARFRQLGGAANYSLKKASISPNCLAMIAPSCLWWGATSSAELTRKHPLRSRSLIEWSTISAKNWWIASLGVAMSLAGVADHARCNQDSAQAREQKVSACLRRRCRGSAPKEPLMPQDRASTSPRSLVAKSNQRPRQGRPISLNSRGLGIPVCVSSLHAGQVDLRLTLSNDRYKLSRKCDGRSARVFSRKC